MHHENRSIGIFFLGNLPSRVGNVGMVGSPSIEAIVKAKPDLILGLDLPNTGHYQTLSKIARSLKASKAGKVYFIPSYLCLALPVPIGTQLYLEEFKKQLRSTKLGSSLLQ